MVIFHSYVKLSEGRWNGYMDSGRWVDRFKESPFSHPLKTTVGEMCLAFSMQFYHGHWHLGREATE